MAQGRNLRVGVLGQPVERAGRRRGRRSFTPSLCFCDMGIAQQHQTEQSEIT